ncbi:MAG: CAP domain-containing protein [SAR202 cluster bacterium]|nr:CAP domain-containing protein [SAR202 cluster bacterium]
MPLEDRDYMRGKHPPACTCVECERRRRGSWSPPLSSQGEQYSNGQSWTTVLFISLVLLLLGGGFTLFALRSDRTSETLSAPTMPHITSITPVPTIELKATPTAAPKSQQRGSAVWVVDLEGQVHASVNMEREKAGIKVLASDQKLSEIARKHSADMAVNDYRAHENQSGQSPSARATTAGYKCRKDYGTYYTDGIAENIFQAWLYSSTTYLNGIPVGKDYMSISELPRQIVDGWMNSPGHRQNILEPNYDRQGIGVSVSSDEKVYVTQNFC